MTAKAKIFNPADFLPPDEKQENEVKDEQNSQVPLTGNSSRDHVRKKLYQVFIAEYADQVDQVAALVVSIENEISAVHKEPKSKEYREKTKDVMIKLEKKTQAIVEVRRQLMTGEVQPSSVLQNDFLSAKTQRPGVSMTNSKGPQSGMPSFGAPIRPGGLRPMAAPGQMVRPRGGMPFPAARVGPPAPRVMPISPIATEQTEESGIQIDTQHFSVPEQNENKILERQISVPIEQHQEPEKLNASSSQVDIIMMDSSHNTTGFQLNISQVERPNIDASLDDSRLTDREGNDTARKKKKKKAKKKHNPEEQLNTSILDGSSVLVNEPEEVAVQSNPIEETPKPEERLINIVSDYSLVNVPEQHTAVRDEPESTFLQLEVQDTTRMQPESEALQTDSDKFLARFDSVKAPADQVSPVVVQPLVIESQQVPEERVEHIAVEIPQQERIEEVIVTSQTENMPTQRSDLSEGLKVHPRRGQVDANMVVLENEIVLLQKKIGFMAEDSRQLREALRLANSRAFRAENAVEVAQSRESYQLQLLQAQLKLKDQTIEKLKQESAKVAEERELIQNKFAQIQKENQMYREKVERQLQSMIASRQKEQTSEHQTSQRLRPVIQKSSGNKLAEASNQQELRREPLFTRTNFEVQGQDHEESKARRESPKEQVAQRNQFGGSGSFVGARQVQNMQQHTQNQNFVDPRTRRNPQRFTANLDVGVPNMENLAQNQVAPNRQVIYTGTQVVLDAAEHEEGGREGEAYFQEVTQDEGTGGESYNQQNQPIAHGMSVPQSSSGSAQQYAMTQSADRGSVGRAYFGVGGDEQMRFQNHGGGVGDGFDGGYGNAVEEDSGDNSLDEEYTSEPERVRALDQEEEEHEEEECYQHFGFSGDSYGQHNQAAQSNLQSEQSKETKFTQRQTKKSVGIYQEEIGEQEDEFDAVEQHEYGGVVENIAAVESEPEEGRERDTTHRQKDADGTGENVDGDLDGDGDQSNSNQNDDDEDIMGNEAHSAPAGGDYQEGDFDGQERSRGEEGGCRDLVNEVDEGTNHMEVFDDVENDIVPVAKRRNKAAAAVSTMQAQFAGRPPRQRQPNETEEEEGGEGISHREFHNGERFEMNGEIKSELDFDHYRSNQQFETQLQEQSMRGKQEIPQKQRGTQPNYEDYEEEKVVSNRQGYPTYGNQAQTTQLDQGRQKFQTSGAFNDFGERPQQFMPRAIQQLQSSSQMGQGHSAGGVTRAGNMGAAASSNQQYPNSMFGLQEESSNGGASAICQTNTAGAAATSARQSVAQMHIPRSNLPSTMQMGATAAQIRNPRQRNTKQTRQVGVSGNLQRLPENQTSSQTRQGQGGRPSRGNQRSNLQHFTNAMQGAPAEDFDSQPSDVFTIEQLSQQQQPFSQSQLPMAQINSSIVASAFSKNSRQRASGGGTSSPNSSSQQYHQNNALPVDSSDDLPSQIITGNAQSVSMASGGSVGTFSSALQVHHMPASHASANQMPRPTVMHRQPGVNSMQTARGGAMAIRQTSAAMISKQIGVVHTANQTNRQADSSAIDSGAGSGGAGLIGSQQVQNSTRHTSEINAESGSTSLTQTNYLQSATQNQQTSYLQESNFTGVSGSSASALQQQVSSPPSTQQTGGNTLQQHYGNAQFQSPEIMHAVNQNEHFASDNDYFAGAVGAPPSRAAVNSQSYKGAQMQQNQTNQGSGAGFGGIATNHRLQMGMNTAAQGSSNSQQQHRVTKQSANNSQSLVMSGGQNQYEFYGNTSNHQSLENNTEQQSLEHLPIQSSLQQRTQMHSNRISAATGEQETPVSMQGVSERINRAGQVYHQGSRGMLQSSSGSGFNMNTFSGETQTNNRQVRQERSNAQDGSWNDQNQGANQSDQSRGQQMSSQPFVARRFNFDEIPGDGLQSNQMQAASGANLGSQMQRQDSRKTSGANTPSKDGADTPTYRNEQSQMQKRPNDTQIFNLTSKKLLVLQEEQQREDAQVNEGQETNDNDPQDFA